MFDFDFLASSYILSKPEFPSQIVNGLANIGAFGPYIPRQKKAKKGKKRLKLMKL